MTELGSWIAIGLPVLLGVLTALALALYSRRDRTRRP